MFQTKAVEKIKTHFVFSNFFSKIVPFMRIWENSVEGSKPQMTIWRVRLAYGNLRLQIHRHMLRALPL